MNLSDIMDADLLYQMVAEGYVKVRSHPTDPDLRIFNYSDKTQIEGMWNEVTRECRGLIVRGGEVVARPFAKFFNLSEHGPEAARQMADEQVLAYDKMDGSLGILYTDPNGMPAIATRGSFESEQALRATWLYRTRYHGRWKPNPLETYLFEIIYPDNRVVLDYDGMDDLVLLGSRNISDGKVFPATVGVWTEWPGPRAKLVHSGSLQSALELPDRPNKEGVVLYTASGKMLKVKQDDYVALHRLVFGLSEKYVWEAVAKGASLDELPEEFQPWVQEVIDRLMAERDAILAQAMADFRECAGRDAFTFPHPGSLDRKEFAAAAVHRENSHLLFKIWDRRVDDLYAAAWKLVRPEHVPFDPKAVAA